MHFLRFSVRQALQGLWRNRVMSLAATVTMVLMLVLLSSLVIVSPGMEAGLSFIESQGRGAGRARTTACAPDRVDRRSSSALEALPEVATVTYVSKEQALGRLPRPRAPSRARRTSATVYADFNPFPAYFAIELRDPRQSRQVIGAPGGRDAASVRTRARASRRASTGS